jgi:Tfp pilus assembly protein PilX
MSRDMNRAFKAANSRIADVETEIAELREQAAATQAAATPVKEARAPRAARAARKTTIDPGDAVPAGVAVEEPQPLDEEAQTAQDALEERLSAS